MLTFLFALAAIWTLFWFVMLMLDWGERSPLADTKALCTKCAAALTPGGTIQPSNNIPAGKASIVAAAANATKNSDSIEKKPVADQHDQANVTPLFEAPNEKDDLKTIKGIGVVMEQTLNDLGITTFKQLAGFKQSDVKMVSDALSESNAGFGDRIARDEWVSQAKGLVQKAS